MKWLKSNIVFSVLMAISFMATVPAHAQLSDSLKNELRKVSNTMYSEGNNNFVIVDLIIDRQITPGAHYNFIYKDGVVIINGRKLPKQLNERYADKLKNYVAASNQWSTTGLSWSSHGETLKDIFNAKSNFRKKDSGNRDLIRDPLVQMLADDKLIDTLSSYSIRYNTHGLFINHKLLSKQKAWKYIKFINESGFIPLKKAQLQFDQVVH